MSNTKANTHNLMERAVESADTAIQTTQRFANHALEGVAESLHTAGKQVRDNASMVSDKTITYIRDEPVKSMLIAAATGAALVALARVVGRSSAPY
jgi:ElaB/YqjD/DUF883 family membrane-anchored ribosome-binding protein